MNYSWYGFVFALLVSASPARAEGWINTIGSKLIDVVLDGEFQSKVPQGQVHFLPSGVKDPMDLVGWKGQSCGDVVQTVEEGGFNETVAKLTYRVVYEYGGSQGQKGRYLSAVQVIPVRMDLKSLYRFDARLEVGAPVNAGTIENPVPRVRLTLTLKIKDRLVVTGERSKTDEIYLDGFGQCMIVQAKKNR